jgi:DNA-binding MarR family transcriptional regulator
MSQKSNESLVGRDIKSSDRAVLAFLYPDHRLTVPEISSRYHVLRQHIQATINLLVKKRLVEPFENSRYKRSPLHALSRKGRALFEKILVDDQKIIESVFDGISKDDLATTRRVLDSMLARLT